MGGTYSGIALAFGALAGVAAAGFVATRVGARAIEARWPARGGFVEIEGRRLHVQMREPEGTPRGDVVLIHGASGNGADMITALAAPLTKAGFRVFAPDRPGHGWSERPPGEAASSPARQAALLRAALEKLGVERATIVGHSWGATVAAALALDHPEFTQGLALLAPVALEWPGGVSWYYDVASTPILGRLFTEILALPLGWLALKRGVASVFAPQAAPADFIDATGVALVLRPEVFRANASDVARLKPFVRAQGGRLSEISAPTTIVTGDRDGVVYTHIHTDGAMALIKGARRVDLPGVGHSPHHAAPRAVAAAIIEVARRAKPAPSDSYGPN